MPHVVHAQETTLNATVTHIAGANVYLNIGSRDDVAQGDTLVVQKNGEIAGQLHVLNVSSTQAVVEFIGQSFAITRANRLTVVLKKSAADLPAEVVYTEPVASEEPPVISKKPARPSPAKRRNQIKIRGRILLNFSMLDSETKPQVAGLTSTHRTFVTPAANLNTTISNLPAGVRLRLNIRTDYRYSAQSSLTRQNTFRTYQLSLEKDMPIGQLQLGRFYNRLTPAGGYWDGVSFLYGSRKTGAGASIGFMPDRSNEGFTTAFPRFSGFAQFETPRKANQPHYRVSGSYHEVQPNSLYLDHKFFGLEQTVNWGPVSINQDLQLDKDPMTSNWVASLFRANTRVKINEWLTIRSRYTLRQPYRMYSTASPISVRRDQIQGGLNFQIFEARIGVSYTTRYTRREYESRTYTAYFTTPLLTPAQVSFFGSVNQWKSDFGTALYLNGGASKPIGTALIRVDYGFYRSTNSNQIDPIDLSRYSISTTLPFSKKLYWNMRTSLQQSQYLRSITFNTSLQYRF
ncbi:MAG: hypothetical protein AB8G77_03975 [Rhodothermales bacterium]